MIKMPYVYRAFSLIELLVVLIIIGILLSAGLPIYRNYVQEARATEAAMAILRVDDDVAKFYERQRGSNGYTGVCDYIKPILDALNRSVSYQISCASATSTTYLIYLVGQNHLAGLKYQLNSSGSSTLSVPDGWVFPSGSCMAVDSNGGCFAASSV